MKKLLIALSLFITSFSFSQNLQNANWCFGTHAGVNFIPQPTPFWSAIFPDYNYGTAEASVSDDNGNLLFYTDGKTVWDRYHAILPNGQGLYGFSDLQDLQKVVIVPKPHHPNIYYIFTLGLIYKDFFGPPPVGQGGIHYTIVDMTPGNEHVDGIIKNISLLNAGGIPIDYPLAYVTSYAHPQYITEHSRITTSMHADGDKIWLTFIGDHELSNSGIHDRFFYNYLVTENGIINGPLPGGTAVPDGTSPRPSVAMSLDNTYYPGAVGVQYTGAMKVSPDGLHFGDSEEGGVNLYSYDNLTGQIPSIPTKVVYVTTMLHAPGFGLEFSPDSKQLYFTDLPWGIMQDGLIGMGKPIPLPPQNTNSSTDIYQYNIEKEHLELIFSYPRAAPSETTGITGIVPIAPLANPCGMQLGIDNRIYVTNIHQQIFYHDRLGVIPDPNTPGTGCGFDPDGLILLPNTFHDRSLPQWVYKVPALPLPPTGPWVWMKGDNVPNQPGSYGTQGSPSSGNNPPARDEAVSWTDQNGIFWMFGGSKSVHEMYNDLWKYDRNTNMWTWVKGSNILNSNGIYGTQGTASPTNQPGARCGSASWVDFAGHALWLYGGWVPTNPNGASDKLNDLWKYDLISGNWTWVSGSSSINQYAIYGTQGVPSLANRPGSKGGATSWFDNDNDHLWLFGGDGFSSAYGGLQNDLWRYSISSHEWTWIKGANNTNDNSTLIGIYGTQGVEGINNRPGSRGGAVAWTDNSNNLWLFSGLGWSGNANPGKLNDLWKFNTISGKWMWVAGDNICDQYGSYGTQGQAAPTNKPGARTDAISWKSADGKFWMLGGIGFSQNNYALLNDLWSYDPAIPNSWTWVNGSSTVTAPAVYGTQGIGSPVTNPGGRMKSTSWIDLWGDLWLFGGYNPLSNPGNMNDLWKYTGNCTGPNCRTQSFARSVNSQNPVLQTALNSLVSKPAILQSKKEESTAITNILSLEIYNSSGQLVKKAASSIDAALVLNTGRAAGLIPGLYFIRIFYADKTVKTTKKILQ